MTDNRTTADRYADWDAAYVLGSLSPAERHEFEEHLASCERCSAAVAELAGMPGLLGRVSADDAFALLAEPGPGAPSEAAEQPDLVPVLLERVRARRRARRGWAIGIASLAAAAAIVAAVIVVPIATGPANAPDVTAQLQQTVSSPLSADVKLTSEQWGTRIDMSCSYASGGKWGSHGPVRYSLWVTETSGESYEVSSWSAGPGTTATPTTTIQTPLARISAVDVRLGSDGAVLLRKSLLPAVS
jgi:hypothetical protein